MSQLVWGNNHNPPFDNLSIKVSPLRSVTLKEVAYMYAWCSLNSTRWNLRVDASNNKYFDVTFAFNDELEALTFKLTWAFN
jgi:hypothetical protein